MGTPAPSGGGSKYEEVQNVRILTVFMNDGSHQFVPVHFLKNGKVVAKLGTKSVSITEGTPAQIATNLFGKAVKSARWAQN